jgi:hypothetical protein
MMATFMEQHTELRSCSSAISFLADRTDSITPGLLKSTNLALRNSLRSKIIGPRTLPPSIDFGRRTNGVYDLAEARTCMCLMCCPITF